MKPVILDTNAFSMVLTDDPRLPETSRKVIASSQRVSLCAISMYEIGQKVRLGKWDAMAKYAPNLVEIAITNGFDLISLSPSQALEASLMMWDHRDPFDRMIAAVTISEEARLVSSDAAFDRVGPNWAEAAYLGVLKNKGRPTPRLLAQL